MENKTHQFLKKKKKKVLENWMKIQLEDNALREDLISNEDLHAQSEELFDEVIEILKYDNLESDAREYERINDILSNISVSRAQQGFSSREIALYVFSLREALQGALEEEYRDDPAYLYKETVRIGKIVDNLGVVTVETFIKGREEVILRQTNEISEISTPVIRVWDGIVAMPIIGTLDSARTQVVMESLLQEITNTGSGIAILDISGVPAVDSLVAQHLIKTVSATRLMGAECIISGIRPEIAQTVVHLGIDLSQIVTKASLASALKYAFQMLKLEVKKADRKPIVPTHG